MQACNYFSIMEWKQKTHRFWTNCVSEVLHLRGQGQTIYYGGSLVCFLHGSFVCQTSLFSAAGLIILLLWLNAADDYMLHSWTQPSFCLNLSDMLSLKWLSKVHHCTFSVYTCICINLREYGQCVGKCLGKYNWSDWRQSNIVCMYVWVQ